MRDYLSLVTFSHTIFALPFALIGFTLAVLQPNTSFEWNTLLLVVLCMVFARNAAMGFNRLVDAPIDAANARTAIRDIPAGKISVRNAGVFVAINVCLFIICARLLNDLCFYLSPVALAVILGYSYTKRFTWLCHVILGVGLSLAPIGAYLAVTGSFSSIPVWFGLVVLLWVAGFDIIYALQDKDFDKANGLNSIPTKFGETFSLKFSQSLHFLCLMLLGFISYRLSLFYPNALIAIWLAWCVFGIALVYQHRIVKGGDLSRIDRAFFTTNGIASVVYATVLITALSIL